MVVASWKGVAGKAVYVTDLQGKVRSGRYGRFRTVDALSQSMAGKHGLVVDWYCKLVLGKAGMAGQGNSRSVVVRNGQSRRGRRGWLWFVKFWIGGVRHGTGNLKRRKSIWSINSNYPDCTRSAHRKLEKNFTAFTLTGANSNLLML